MYQFESGCIMKTLKPTKIQWQYRGSHIGGEISDTVYITHSITQFGPHNNPSNEQVTDNNIGH